MKRLTLFTLTTIMFLTGCALLGGGRYRSYKRLQGHWELDTYWTSQRADAHVKANWGDPRRNERAKQEFDKILNAADQISFTFDKKHVTIKQGKKESKSRWAIIDYNGRDDSILLRKLGESRADAHTHKRLTPQELVNLLDVQDGDLPHVLGIRFLDSRHIEFFTLKVIAGKISDYENASGLQVYAWKPLEKKKVKKKPTPTPRPTPTPTPVMVKPVVQPTPIPTFRVPPRIPLMKLPEITPTPKPEAKAPAASAFPDAIDEDAAKAPATSPEAAERPAATAPEAEPARSRGVDLNAPVRR